jgi:putative flavoprotein involved in K+ transport
MIDQTVIVGAGPAGLAVAAMLGGRGAAYTVLERAGSVASSWRGRYDSLQLHTARRLSALPGAPIPRGYGRWVRRDDLVAYLDEYAARFQIEPEFGVEVGRIDRDRAGWRVETSAGPRLARTVVIATGYGRTPYVPDWPGLSTFAGAFCHSSAYRAPSSYRRKAVLVVGAGNSAAEIAVELAAADATVQLSVRTPPNIVRRDVLGVPSQVIGVALRRVPERLMNPMIGLMRRLTVPDLREFGLPAPPGDGFTQFLRSRTVPILDHGFVAAIRAGRITVVPTVESVDGPDVHLAGGTIVRPDSVIAATGYRPDLGQLVGHVGVLDATGAPRVHGAQTVAGAPGLYFVGIDVELSGLLREIAREAGEVAEKISAESGVGHQVRRDPPRVGR